MLPAMAEPDQLPSNKRRVRTDDVENTSPADGTATAPKRRAFLQTMGQQLREFGNGTEATSPQGAGRATFGTSPRSNICPPSASSRALNSGGQQPQSGPIDTPESDGAPGEDDQLPAGAAKSASKWLWRSNEVLHIPAAGRLTPFSFEDLLDWSQSYFNHWHPAFPFLHAPALLTYFRQVAQRGISQDIPNMPDTDVFHLTILRSIMSISAADRRQMGGSSKPLHPTLVFHSFNEAINSVQRVLTVEGSILSLQALVSVQLFLITMHRYNAASRLEGLAVRMTFQLNLHRCPLKTDCVPSKEAELRKRLFWSVFCVDRYICIRLGTPLGIRSDEIDVCFPHDERHDTAENRNAEHDDRLDLLEFLSRHADIRGSIMDSRTKSAIDSCYNDADRLMDIDAEHTKWWNVVDEYLSNDDQSETVVKVHRVALVVLRFETVLALHRSVLATSNKSSAYNAALQRCISASRSIINVLHKSLEGVGAFDGSPGQHGYESTPLLWPSFTWAVWMSAFIIIFAATEEQIPRDVAFRLADRSVEILRHLALRATSWPEACIIAIQNLRRRLNERSTRSSTVENLHTSGRLDRNSATLLLRNEINLANPVRSRTRVTRSGTVERARISGHVTPNLPPTTTQTTSLLPLSQAPHFAHHVQHANPSNSSTNLDAFMLPKSPTEHLSFQDHSNIASTHLAGSGTFLGIAQQLSDNPIPDEEIMNLFSGEDFSLWMTGDSGYGGG